MFNRQKLIKEFLTSILIITLLTINVHAAGVYDDFGGLGVDDYSTCPYGNRGGAAYLDKLSNRMPISVSIDYKYKNSSATVSRFYNSGTVDLFTYSGHGTVKGNTTCAHFAVPSHTTHSSGVESNEASTLGAYFHHKYVSMYTCNWLNHDTSTRRANSWSTFGSNNRIQCGFGTQMYLNSWEGNMFGYRMVDYVETIKTAFFESAKNYQPQNSDPVTVRVSTYLNAKNDTFYAGYSGSVPAYSSSNSSLHGAYSIVVQ